jgi:hypothetical protein
MSQIDHAAAHERIEDLLLEPARLAAFARSTAPDEIALRDHLAGCPACRADLETWSRLQAALGDALPGAAAEASGAVEQVELPASLRARVISAVRSDDAPIAPVAMAAERRRPWWGAQTRLAGLGMAAALVVLAVGAGLLVDEAGKLSAAQADAQGLADAMAAVDRVLVEPQHRVVALSTPAGAAAGSISWTRHDLVVLTSALQAPKPGEVYRCWLSDDGTGWAIGKMYFADGTAYWVGTLDQWASFEIGPTTMFRVSLEPPGADPAKRSGPIVLEAALGS